MDNFVGSLSAHLVDSHLWKIIEESANEIYLFGKDDFKFVAVNAASLKNTGYSLEEMHRLTPWDLKPEFDEAEFKKLIFPLIDGENSVLEFKTTHERKDGSLYNAEVRLQLSKDPQFPYFFAIIRDTTQYDKTVEDLAEQKHQLNHIFDTVTLGMIICDAKGVIKRINPAVVDIFGYSEDELIGNNVKMLMRGHDHRYHDKYISAYLTSGVKKIIGIGRDVHACRKNGQEFLMNLAIDDLSTDENIEFVASIRDLSEQERLREKLRHSQKLEMIGRFTGGIAHDFNNLLAIVKGNLSLLKADIEDVNEIDQDEILELANDALDASNRGETLIKRLLMFSRLEAPETVAIKIDDTIAGMKGIFNRSIKRSASLDLILNAPEVIIQADAAQLESTLLNLVVNGSDAIEESGKITITTNLKTLNDTLSGKLQDLARGDYLEIAISDNGAGMSEDVRAKAMEPFFTTKAYGAGSGLGLAMAFAFVNQLRGQIRIDSEKGAGTTVTLLLPAEVGDHTTNMHRGEQDFDYIAGGEERILVVEDEVIVLRTIKRILERKGYSVLVAENGEAAHKIIESDANFDLIITDIAMPGMIKGPDIARFIEHNYPHIKTLLISANADEAINISRRGDKKFNILGKPFSPTELTEVVRQLLDE